MFVANQIYSPVVHVYWVEILHCFAVTSKTTLAVKTVLRKTSRSKPWTTCLNERKVVNIFREKIPQENAENISVKGKLNKKKEAGETLSIREYVSHLWHM